jgi:amidophosphoribosyltransferase
MKTFKNVGTVKNVFDGIELPNIKKGIGHVRYSTVKKIDLNGFLKECQPFQGSIDNINFALAHNGNIPTKNKIKEEFGLEIETNSDTLIIVKLIEAIYPRYNNWKDTLTFLMNTVSGSYCFVILADNKIWGMRDRFGIRPLAIGKSRKGFCITSETVALSSFNYVRDVNPGEIICVDSNSLDTIYQCENTKPKFCSFEMIYFMHHDSIVNNMKCDEIRYNLGFKLGKRETDIIDDSSVVCLPNSSIPNARGFADAIYKQYLHFIQKRKNMTRTFILPSEKKRKEACDKKFIFAGDGLKNKNIYLVDDSIVGGTTMKSSTK